MAQRFTVYDVMEAKGVFKKNPANIGAQDEQGMSTYEGPNQYPKMLYHPKGEERILQEGEVIQTPLGPKLIMQQRELIWEIAKNAQEEADLRAEGWHTHPADALRAAGKTAPPTGADQTIAELKRKIEELEKQRVLLEGQATPPKMPPGISGVAPPVNPLSK